jgi:ubiquinone biosynthesis protein
VERLNGSGTDIFKEGGPVDQNMGTFERIRFALEDFGPTFVKIGPVMSLKPDLLPADPLIELGKLQDDVPLRSRNRATG